MAARRSAGARAPRSRHQRLADHHTQRQRRPAAISRTSYGGDVSPPSSDGARRSRANRPPPRALRGRRRALCTMTSRSGPCRRGHRPLRIYLGWSPIEPRAPSTADGWSGPAEVADTRPQSHFPSGLRCGFCVSGWLRGTGSSLSTDLVVRGQAGDLEAFGRLVQATQTMAYAVARGVLRDSGLAAGRRPGGVSAGVSAASAISRSGRVRRLAPAHRHHRRAEHAAGAPPSRLLRLDDVPDVPVLDEAETSWTELQRQRLARALLTLTAEERRLCDRRYHGRWSTARLAQDAGVDEPAMRKRLQRVRDKLRKEIEVSEQRAIRPRTSGPTSRRKVVELLARPQLTDLPENPVGKVLELLRTVYADFADRAAGDRRLRGGAEDDRQRRALHRGARAASRRRRTASCATT